MTKSTNHAPRDDDKVTKSKKEQRDSRLSDALRENLKRRKKQADKRKPAEPKET